MKARPQHPAYPLMLAESSALALPKRFKTDLTKHDRQWLKVRAGDPAAPFLWCLYEHGTWILNLDWRGQIGPRRNESAAAWAEELIKTFGPGRQIAPTENFRLYVWDGVALIPFFADAKACRAKIEEMIEAMNTKEAKAV